MSSQVPGVTAGAAAVVTGAAALWRWDALFLDRRDYTNLVSLPLSLRTIFFANLSAILALAAVFTIVVNASRMCIAANAQSSALDRNETFSLRNAVRIFRNASCRASSR